MSTTSEKDLGFPWFEDQNFSGWLIQFKAHLRKTNSHKVLEEPRPTEEVDEDGDPIPMNQAQRQRFQREVEAYDELDNIAFSELMKACRLNPKTKNLCETGGFETAYDLLTRLKTRFHNVDEMTKASHLLRYHSLRQADNESGADFVDREQKEYLALREMGINVDDSLRLTKFIQPGTTNQKHKSLAQTIFTTPDMTLRRATSLFESWQPEEAAPSINVVKCKHCNRPPHKSGTCPALEKQREKRHHRGRNNKTGSKKSTRSSKSPAQKKWKYPCVICDSYDHATYLCPRKDEVKKCLESTQKNVTWGGDDSDEA
jgi:hypothetical protein